MTYVPRPETGGKGLTFSKRRTLNTVFKQPESSYLAHFTPDSGKSLDIMKNLNQTVVKYNLLSCLKVIGSGSTAVNTGYKGGVIALFEQVLDHRPWLICLLHINELKLRHLFFELDDPTQGDKAFKGPIGKLLKFADECTVNEIIFHSQMVKAFRYLPQDVIKDLSRDLINQHYLHEIVNLIWTGIMSDIAKNHKIGPIIRWVTLARRIGRHYASNV